MSKSNTIQFDQSYTEEEIAYWGRKLQAEIQKQEKAVERKENLISELKTKGFLSFGNKRKELNQAEKELIDLQNRLIELKAMMPLDYLIEEKGNDKKKSSLNINGVIDNVGTVVETVSKFIPIAGVSEVGKLSGKFLKSLGNKKK